MAFEIPGDLNLRRALLLDGNAGLAGQWPVSTAGGEMDWQSIADLISADAGNDLILGDDGGLKLIETVSSLSYDSGTTVLSFTDEAGNVTQIDLGALTTDIYVNGASISGDTLILTDNSGGTTDVTVDLSSFRGEVTVNGNGTFDYDDGSGSTTNVDMKLGVSVQAGNDLSVGSDGLPYFGETITTLAILNGVLAYQREDGQETTVDLISSSANNRLTYSGSPGRLFVPQIRSTATFNATTDWGSASGGLYTLTISAASFHNAHANAIFQVQRGATAPFETALGMHSAKLNGDGSVTLQVCATPDARFGGRVTYIA